MRYQQIIDATVLLEQRFPFSLINLILPLKSEKNCAIRPGHLSNCVKTTNTKAVILIEIGADDYLVGNESKERSFAEMIQAGVEWNFHDRPGTPHGLSLPTT